MIKPEHINQLQDGLKAWLAVDHPDHSQNKLSDQSGVNARFIQLIADGKTKYMNGEKEYTIKPENYRKIARIIGIDLDDRIHLEDENLNLVFRACHFAQKRHRRVLIDSTESGDGKTYSLERYAAQNDQVLYVKIQHNMKGYELINHIMKLMGIRLSNQIRPTNTNKLKRITDELIRRPNFLLILDEAEGRRTDLNPIIKDIEDATYGLIGFVLCGLGIIEEFRIGCDRGRKYIPQLDRRFSSSRVKLRQLTNEDIKIHSMSNGITDLGAISVLQKRIRNKGMLVEYLTDIRDLYLNQGLKVGRKQVESLFNDYAV